MLGELKAVVLLEEFQTIRVAETVRDNLETRVNGPDRYVSSLSTVDRIVCSRIQNRDEKRKTADGRLI
jgi:hypothetical protein